MNPVLLAFVITGALLAGMLVAIEIGHRLGRRRRAKHPDQPEGGGPVEAAVLGLLGLTLAFTFSAASERLLIRRAQIVDEANAIGTAYLRVDLLSPADQPTIRDLFRRYLETRLEAFDKVNSQAAMDAALARGEALQREIWSHSVEACKSSPFPSAPVILLPALNQMIDITTTRTVASRTHVPTLVVVLLLALALLGGLLSGYSMSVQAKRSRIHMIVFALAISAMTYVVLDLEYPRSGFITIFHADRAIIHLRDLMK
jgi:hypothetical protein